MRLPLLSLILLLLPVSALARQPRPWAPDQRPTIDRGRRGTVQRLGNVRWGYVRSDTARFGDVARPVYSRDTAVDLSKVSRVYFAVQRFDPQLPRPLRWLARFVGNRSVGHGMLLFRFKDGGVKTVSLGQDPNRSGGSSRGLWYSTEARLRKGQRYSFIRGLFSRRRGGYGVVNALSSFRDRIVKSCGMEACRVDLYRLKLDRPTTTRLLDLALGDATGYDPKESYHTFNNNCATRPMGLVEQAAGVKLGRGRRIPRDAVSALARAGLIEGRPTHSFVQPPGAHR